MDKHSRLRLTRNPDLDRFFLRGCFGGKGSAPPQPDYAGAAREQGVANKETAIAQALMNNPNIVNPYGSRTVTWSRPSAPGGGGTVATQPTTTFDQSGYDAAMANYERQRGKQDFDASSMPTREQFMTTTGGTTTGGSGGAQFPSDIYVPTITDTLSPEQQRLFEQQNRISQGVGDIAEASVGRVGAAMGTPFDASPYAIQRSVGYSGPGVQYDLGANPFQIQGKIANAGSIQKSVGPNDFVANRDQVTQSIIDRNAPFATRERDRLDNQLRNQGVMPGTQAYSEAMRDLDTKANDFNLGAIQAGGAEQSRLFGLDLSQGQFANTAQQQQFGQNQAQLAANNAAQQQALADMLQRGQFHNAGVAQGFNQAQAEAQFANQATNQAYQQALNTRELPLNEVNALRTGAQVTAPQFPGYNPTSIQPAPIYQAAQNQYQANLNNYNAQNASNNAFTSGLFGMAGAAMPLFTGGTTPWIFR